MSNNICRNILCILASTALATGCKKFDDINTNPNRTTSVSSAMLATTMISSITRGDISTTKTFMQPYLLGKYVTWGEGSGESFAYNRLSNASFGRITLLRNVKPMIEYAPNDGLKKSYTALGHFIRAWEFFYTTMQVGDIPYTEAVKGETDAIVQPKYDAQKTVFLGILNELDSANTLFSQGVDFLSGDFIYANKIDKWRRLTNSFELYVLINLYKKTGDADLNVVNRFKEIVANRPLMRDYNDNFALAYNSTAGQNYPWSDVPAGSSNSFIKSNYTMLSANLIDPLKATKDKRLFYFAKPSPIKITAGLLQTDYNAYIGAEASNSHSSLGTMRGTKDYSDFNDRYVELVNAEPVSIFSYWDLQFILAEAATRGWITGPAQDYYAAGIKSAIKFTASYTPDVDKYHHTMKMDDAYINAFPASAGVALAGTTEQRIAQIIMQKYLAGFLQGSNYTAWYENRRTGYPTFILNPSTNRNNPSTKFPVRWVYPSNELSYNTDNLNKVIDSQYAGTDDTNGVMWLLK